MNFISGLLFASILTGISALAQEMPASAAAGREKHFLVRDGVFCGEIFVADDCSTEELEAAQDLARWIDKVCGTEVSVRLESFGSRENAAGIFLGKTQAARREGIAVAPELGPEAFTVCSRGDALFLVGASDMATRHAAAKLLTGQFGVEFVFPGEDGAEWTPKTQVEFPAENRVYTRPWTWRSIGVRGEEIKEWAVHLGFGERPIFSHNLYTIFTPEVYERYPQLAPKCFGKINASRRGGYAPQANLANPLAVSIASDAAKKYFDAHGDAAMFSVGINDCLAWDESEESAAAYGSGSFRWFRNLPNRSDYFWRFADCVARTLAETTEYADKEISAIAYLDCLDAPSFPLVKNVFPVVCADRSLWVFPQFAEEDKALMRRWGQSGVRAWGIYDYYYGNPFLFPRVFFKAQEESIRHAYENRARLFYAEVFPQEPFDAPKIWVLSRLLEDPATNADRELMRFCELAYGKASEPMYEFFKLCEKDWREQGGQCRWIKAWRNENSTHLFKAEKSCEELLGKAQSCFSQQTTDARDLRIIARLEQTRLYLERAKKFGESFRAREALEIDSRNPEKLDAVLESPAWCFEEIYDDVAWLENYPEAGFAPVMMRESDPRATALVRITDAWSGKPPSPERRNIERKLLSALQKMSRRADTDVLQKMIPALRGAPVFKEDFEEIESRDSETGKINRESCFAGINQDGWRAGKTVASPASLTLVTAPAEKLFCGESDSSCFGIGAVKISGGCESTEFSKRLPAKPGICLAASVWARGKTSVGATAGMTLVWKDARGNQVGEEMFVRIACGEFRDWARFVVAGKAPEGASFGEVHFGAGLFAPDDYVCFDEFEIFEF